MAFLGFLQRKNIIEPKEAMISGTVLTGLSQQNPETGERFLTAGFTLYNRQLLLGPLRIMEIPEISWPYDAPLSLFEREEQQLNPQQPGP